MSQLLRSSRHLCRALRPLLQTQGFGAPGLLPPSRAQLGLGSELPALLAPLTRLPGWSRQALQRPFSSLISAPAVAEAKTLGAQEDQEVPVLNFQGERTGLAVLGGDVFDVPIRKDVVHQVVRWQLARRQQGTHSTKGVHEVSGTGRKPYRQKGTGGARHGSMRGPQFRGGATMHGPKPRSHAIKLNKRVRRLGLKVALSARLAEGKLLVLDTVEAPTGKTTEMAKLLEILAREAGSRKFLFVDGTPQVNATLVRSTSNLSYVNVLPFQGLNVYSILQHDTLVMSLEAVRRIEERLRAPINR